MTFYEAPTSNPELAALAQQRPTAILEAMVQTLRAARWSGYLRPDVDLPVLADRIVQTMLQVGLDVHASRLGRRRRSPRCCAGFCWRDLPQCRRPMPKLDRSAAFIAADDVVKSWTDDSDAELNDKGAYVRAVARTEFGRRVTKSPPSETSLPRPDSAPARCIG